MIKVTIHFRLSFSGCCHFIYFWYGALSPLESVRYNQILGQRICVNDWLWPLTRILMGFLALACSSQAKHKGIDRAKHNTTTSCRQCKVEQVYVLLDTVNNWTHKCFGQLSCILNVKYAFQKYGNAQIWLLVNHLSKSNSNIFHDPSWTH